jgi:hypothetical protein
MLEICGGSARYYDVNEDKYYYIICYIHLGANHNFFFMHFVQHCFICRPSDSTVSEDDVIEPRTVATLALAVRRSARSHPQKKNSKKNPPVNVFLIVLPVHF